MYDLIIFEYFIKFGQGKKILENFRCPSKVLTSRSPMLDGAATV